MVYIEKKKKKINWPPRLNKGNKDLTGKPTENQQGHILNINYWFIELSFGIKDENRFHWTSRAGR